MKTAPDTPDTADLTDVATLRDRILAVLGDRVGSAVSVAARLGIPRIRAWRALEAMVRDGLLFSSLELRSRSGRPSTMYFAPGALRG